MSTSAVCRVFAPNTIASPTMVLNETSSSPASPSMSNLSTDDACIGEGSPDSVPPQHTPIDADARAWIDEHIAEEVARLKAAGVEAVPLKVCPWSVRVHVPECTCARACARACASMLMLITLERTVNARRTLTHGAPCTPHATHHAHLHVQVKNMSTVIGVPTASPASLPRGVKPVISLVNRVEVRTDL